MQEQYVIELYTVVEIPHESYNFFSKASVIFFGTEEEALEKEDKLLKMWKESCAAEERRHENLYILTSLRKLISIAEAIEILQAERKIKEKKNEYKKQLQKEAELLLLNRSRFKGIEKFL